MTKPPRICGACERHKLRKGKARRAWVPEPDGTMRYTLVCVRCWVRGFVVVTPPPTTVPPLCCACHRDKAGVCLGCYARLIESNQELTKANVALAARKS